MLGSTSSTFATLKAMNSVTGSLRSGYVRALPSFLFCFAGGVLLAHFLLPQPDKDHESGVLALIAAVLAFGGLLVGMLVTVMVFTGKIESPETVSLEVVRAYITRLKLLLASQAKTLVAAIITCVLSVLSLVMHAAAADALGIRIIDTALFGFLSVCFFRCIILPIQVFELHEAWLEGVLQAKIDEERRAIETGRRPPAFSSGRV
jgi:hypothetical protein